MLVCRTLLSNKNFQIGIIGMICFLIHVFILYWMPMESWCDDAFYADLGYQLSIGSDTSHVFPDDKVEVSLLGLMYAMWYKIVGFSYFTAQLPNLIFSLFSFVILARFIVKQTTPNSILPILTLGILFWFAPVNYWTMCCGRPEMFSLLFGIIVIVCFISDFEKPSIKKKGLLGISSFILLSINYQGVLGVTILLAIYCLFDVRSSLLKPQTLLANLGGYIFAFLGICTIKLFSNTLKKYIFHILGYSTTLQPIYKLLYKIVYNKEYTGQNNLTSTIIAENTSLWDQILNGFPLNKDYFFLAILLLLLSIIILGGG